MAATIREEAPHIQHSILLGKRAAQPQKCNIKNANDGSQTEQQGTKVLVQFYPEFNFIKPLIGPIVILTSDKT